MQRREKETFVQNLSDQMKASEAVFITQQSGLTVAEATDLRFKVRQSGAKYRVAKNTLARRAVEKTSYEPLLDNFTGPTAITLATDPVSAAKVIVAFAKANDKLELVAGAMGAVILSREEIVALSKLPTLDELRGKIVALVTTPATQIARLASEPAAQLARLFSAYAESNKDN